jgi:Flp pilus assembly protein TadD
MEMTTKFNLPRRGSFPVRQDHVALKTPADSMPAPLFRPRDRGYWRSGSFYILSSLTLMMLFLPACTTTKSLQYSPITSRVSHDPSAEQESKLISLSHDELIARGNQYLQGGNRKLAQVHFRMALNKNVDSVPAYLGIGEILALEGENRTAHQMLAKALAIDGNHRQTLIAIGKLFQKENNYQQAEVYFDRAREIYPADSEILTELAITYGNLGQEERAEPLLHQVVAQKPGDPSAYNNLGFNYLLQNKYPEAIETLQKALSLAPGDPRIQNNLAATYALNNKCQKAFDLLSQTEGEAAAYNDLGYFYMKRGLKDPAKYSFEKALKLHPKLYVRARENLRRLDNEL